MHFRDIIADSIYAKDWVTMIMVQNKYVYTIVYFQEKRARFHNA